MLTYLCKWYRSMKSKPCDPICCRQIEHLDQITTLRLSTKCIWFIFHYTLIFLLTVEDEQVQSDDDNPVIIVMYADDATIARVCAYNGSRVTVIDPHGGMYRDSTENV